MSSIPTPSQKQARRQRLVAGGCFMVLAAVVAVMGLTNQQFDGFTGIIVTLNLAASIVLIVF
jgi:hypothetical protein